MHKIIISKTAKKVISNSQLKTENSAVKMIPAFEQDMRRPETAKQIRKLRVAAYCRVSTGEESQQGSFTSQISYFKSVITNNPDWELVEIYVDENRSGTSRTRRQGFNQMIEDAKAGKIDHILTKSLSRFARNTVDTLNCIQELRNLQPSVGVYFQKENMYTLNRKYDFILTTMAALAQNESYSIAENIRWGLRKKFRNGVPQINLKRMLGYDMGNNGKWVINSDQAKIVRYIYRKYLRGCSAHGISVELNQRGIKTVNGKEWCTTSVLCILQNEKYIGDLLIQKAPACTIQTQAEAVCELFGGKKEDIKVIGIRHGEKMYETLLTNEECAKAVDMGNFYRVPADNRGLNYDKYFKDGDDKRNTLTEFNSNNTTRLNLEETKAKIAALAYIQEELEKME